MQWINVDNALPELHFISETQSMSKVYPVWVDDDRGNKYISTAFLVKYTKQERSFWVMEYEYKRKVTHWIDTEGPHESE